MGQGTEWKRLIAVGLAAAAMLGVGCGGGDENQATAEGATGAPGLVEGAAYDITVSEFIAELQPQKREILEELVADSAACEGVKADNGFVLLVTAEGLDAGQEAPLVELVEDQC